MKSKLSACLLLACVLFAPPLAAEQSLSANDLAPAALAAPLAVEGFTILATADKGVTVEAVTEGRTAADGEVFNLRIKLNGSGSTAFRALKFSVAGPAELLVYLNSSSKTDARILRLSDAAGTSLAELTAPPDDGLKAGMASLKLEKAGDYYLFSAASGINIYAIVLR
jgi:hypothetical protein